MKIPRRVTITKKVCDEIKKARMEYLGDNYCSNSNYDDDGYTEELHQSLLFLLGADAKGVIKKAIRLEQDLNGYETEGCEYMPGIREASMRRAYLEIVKAKLNVIGFAHKIHETMLPHLDKHRWDYVMGDLMWDFPGFVLVRFHPEPKALGFPRRGATRWIPLTVRAR